jgi:hypothetical protein
MWLLAEVGSFGKFLKQRPWSLRPPQAVPCETEPYWPGPAHLNAGGRTIIMVTHDEDVAGHAKRIIRVRDGRIVDDRATGRG